MVNEGQLQAQLLEHPMLWVEAAPGVEQVAGVTIQRQELVFSLHCFFFPRRCWARFAQPDGLVGGGLECVVEMLQAAVAAEGHDGCRLTLHRQHGALVFHRELAAYGGEAVEASDGLLDLPAVSHAKGLELLDGDRVQGIAQG